MIANGENIIRLRNASLYLLTHIPPKELSDEIRQLKYALMSGSITINYAISYIFNINAARQEVIDYIQNNVYWNDFISKIPDA